MANDNDGNGSQFFITLDRQDDLNKKNTIFGTLKGNTLFNVLTMAELPVDGNDRPEDPPRIKRVQVLNAYFTDIIPRTTASAAPVHVVKKKERKVKAVKNFKLMSFGDEAEEEEIGTIAAAQKMGKIVSSHDAGVDRKLRPESAVLPTEVEAAAAAEASVAKDRAATKRKAASAAERGADGGGSAGVGGAGGADDPDDGSEMTDHDFDAQMKAKMASKRAKKEATNGSKGVAAVKRLITADDRIAAHQEEARLLEAELRTPKPAAGSDRDGAGSAGATERNDAQLRLDREAAEYEAANRQLRGFSKQGRQDATMAMLGMFQSKLKAPPSSGEAVDAEEDAEATGAAVEEAEEEEYDADWMNGALDDETYDRFATNGIDPRLDPNQCTLEDPRNPMNQRRRGEKANEKKRGGGGGGGGGGRGEHNQGGGQRTGPTGSRPVRECAISTIGGNGGANWHLCADTIYSVSCARCMKL
jgi:peptidyl-prolyl cis-trans isomerase SDCCAG10